jgi:hypothetical protein
MTRIRLSLLAVGALLGTLAASAQDAITVASTSANSGAVVSVAVSIRDAAGTPLGSDATAGNRIQGVSFLLKYDPAFITSVTFSRAGVMQNLVPLYERTVNTSGRIGYIASFSETTQPIPFTTGTDRVGTLTVQLASGLSNGATTTLTLDPLLTGLANQDGTLFETRYNSHLTISSGSITIGGSSTTTTLASSHNPSTEGSSVTFTATVSSAGSIGGTMSFWDGSAALGFTTVQSGVASFTTASLSSGAHSISAKYEGDATHLPSTSNIVTQTVNHVLDAPANVQATATSTTSVDVTWSAVAGATGYEVRRSSNHGSYVLAGSTNGTFLSDGGRSPGTTYLYVVRAVNASGTSPDSALDPATTIMFTDDPLVASVTSVKYAHLTELRTAVNAFRASAGLGPVTYTDYAGAPIKKLNVEELRDALLTARSLLGLSAPSFTDPTLVQQSTPVRAAHYQEIRNAVK